MLQPAFEQKKRLTHDRHSIFRKDVRRNDGVRDPGFIFDAQEHEAFRRARPLPRNHRSRDAQMDAVGKAFELVRAPHPKFRHGLAAEGHWMRPHGHSRAAKISDEPLGVAHRR